MPKNDGFFLLDPRFREDDVFGSALLFGLFRNSCFVLWISRSYFPPVPALLPFASKVHFVVFRQINNLNKLCANGLDCLLRSVIIRITRNLQLLKPAVLSHLFDDFAGLRGVMAAPVRLIHLVADMPAVCYDVFSVSYAQGNMSDGLGFTM
jgi:hypothetical protein